MNLKMKKMYLTRTGSLAQWVECSLIGSVGRVFANGP